MPESDAVVSERSLAVQVILEHVMAEAQSVVCWGPKLPMSEERLREMDEEKEAWNVLSRRLMLAESRRAVASELNTGHVEGMCVSNVQYHPR